MKKSVAKALKTFVLKEAQKRGYSEKNVSIKGTYRKAKKNFLKVPSNQRKEVLMNL
jgi:hypothetical protein